MAKKSMQPDFELLSKRLRNTTYEPSELRSGLPFRWIHEGVTRTIATDGRILVVGPEGARWSEGAADKPKNVHKLADLALASGPVLGRLDLRAVRERVGLPSVGGCVACAAVDSCPNCAAEEERACPECQILQPTFRVVLAGRAFNRAVFRVAIMALPPASVTVMQGPRVLEARAESGLDVCALCLVAADWRVVISPIRDTNKDLPTVDLEDLLDSREPVPA